jgi:hypothetical protein
MFKQGTQIRRDGGRPGDRAPIKGMSQTQAPRMKCLPAETGRIPATAIHRIADQGEPEVLQVYPDLMGAPGLKRTQDQRCWPAIELAPAPDRLKISDSLTPSVRL